MTENTLVVVKWSQITNFNLTVKWKPESPVFSAKKEECANCPNLWQKCLNKVLEWWISLCVWKKQVVTCLTSLLKSLLLNPVWTLSVGWKPRCFRKTLFTEPKLYLQSEIGVKETQIRLGNNSPRMCWMRSQESICLLSHQLIYLSTYL